MRTCLGVLVICFTVLGSSGALAQAARPAARPAGAVATSTTTSSATGVVDINAATEEQLVLLPGIGPAKARAIVAARQRMGHFRHVEDLRRVRGIGRVTLRRLRPMLTVSGGTTLTARPSHRRDTPSATSPQEGVAAAGRGE